MTDPGPTSPPEWEPISSREMAEYATFRVRRDRVRSPLDGAAHDFDVAVSPDGVSVLAFTGDDELVLVAQYRVPLRAVSLELPSGVVDEGEDPVAAGLRELREETGYRAESGEALGVLVLNPSWQTTRVHVVLARGVRRAGAKEMDSGEDTRVRLVPRGAVAGMLARGELASATAVAALALLWAGGERAGRDPVAGVD